MMIVNSGVLSAVTRATAGKRNVPADIKKQILERVREGKKTVKEIAEEHGVSTGTIYAWTSESVGGEITRKEHMDLQRENTQLKILLGELTVKMSTNQKKVW
jgi:transposase-like protein